MIYEVNLSPQANIAQVLSELGNIGVTTTPFPRNPYYVHLEAPEGAGPSIESIEGVDGCCCGDTPATLNFVEIKAQLDSNQPLTTGQWGLGYISGREDLTSYEYEADGTGVWIFNVDTPADPNVSDFGGRCTVIHEHPNPGTLEFNHGTMTLGFAGGTEYGIAKGASLFNAAGFDGSANGTTTTINAALNAVADYIEDNTPPIGAVVNCSFSTSGFAMSDPYSASINRLDSLGAVVVTSSGNDGLTLGSGFTNVWPSMNTKVVTVGAHDRFSERPSFSNQGSALEIYAPGLECAVMGLNDAILIGGGTSFSAPHVSGVLACAMQAGIDDVVQWLLDESIPGIVTNVSSGTKAITFKSPTLAGEEPTPPETETGIKTGILILDGGNADNEKVMYTLSGGDANTPVSPFHIINEQLLTENS